ncbi:uncharacterized protein E0L32_005664 [Thyridium curvatum]|uniref:Uncharacterized protein n=1 Tax=Thyridium curvatum TaxID=1093900 RepID=A0A507B5I3_9PEZI|nr:uncharacterized protein E0L32_005664 [Thyridium curvatum]TPX13964.1 hypothetical protein E0L32_005664 [Thyridium curvatum]
MGGGDSAFLAIVQWHSWSAEAGRVPKTCRDSRLGDLTEVLFERAPYCRGGQFRGAGTRLAALCRGPAAAHSALHQLEERWADLDAARQTTLRTEWEIQMIRFYHDTKESCSACQPVFGNGGYSQAMDCSVCAIKASTMSEDLEKFANTFADKFKPEPSPPEPPPPPPEPAPAPAAEPDPELLEKIKALELRVAVQKDALGELQKVIDGADTEKEAHKKGLEESEKAKQDLQSRCDTLETDIRSLLENIEKFAEDLDIGMRWQTAQMAYAALHKFTLARRSRLESDPAQEETCRELEVKALCFKHKQIQSLTKLGRFSDAEPMAKQVWERRKELLPADAKETRAISRDFCDILRKNGKYFEAERELVSMWYNSMQSVPGAEEEEWKLETASRIGEVMAEQRKFADAASWHRRVLEQRLAKSPLDVEKASAAAVQCISAQNQQDTGFVIMDHAIIPHLERIWKERTPNTENENVLTCGHELGVRLIGLAKDDEAAPILLSVWEKRKAFGPPHQLEAMETALALVDLSVKTENLPRLETLYHWITMNRTPDQSETEHLWYRYRLGCVQAVLEKWAIAEDNLRKVLSHHKQLFGSDDPDTIQYTQVLAEVLRRENRLDDALRLVQPLWEDRQRHPRSWLQATLRIGHLYGDILNESNSPADLAKAEAILREVWESTATNISSMMPLASLVPAGDCYGISLMKRQKFLEARPIFAQVAEWKRWLGFDQKALERSEHLAMRATEWGSRKHPPIYRPTPVYHQLRLRDFLDRWFSSTVVTAAITDS